MTQPLEPWDQFIRSKVRSVAEMNEWWDRFNAGAETMSRIPMNEWFDGVLNNVDAEIVDAMTGYFEALESHLGPGIASCEYCSGLAKELDELVNVWMP